MTTASIPRHASPPSRFGWAAGLIRLAVFLVFHPSAPVPDGLLNVRVPDAPRGIRVDVLEEIAFAYRTSTVRRFGCQVAERRFGPVTVEAHLKDEDYTAQLAALITREEAAA